MVPDIDVYFQITIVEFSAILVQMLVIVKNSGEIAAATFWVQDVFVLTAYEIT